MRVVHIGFLGLHLDLELVLRILQGVSVRNATISRQDCLRLTCGSTHNDLCVVVAVANILEHSHNILDVHLEQHCGAISSSELSSLVYTQSHRLERSLPKQPRSFLATIDIDLAIFVGEGILNVLAGFDRQRMLVHVSENLSSGNVRSTARNSREAFGKVGVGGLLQRKQRAPNPAVQSISCGAVDSILGDIVLAQHIGVAQ